VCGWQNEVSEINVVIMSYFPAIGQSIAEILQFNGFQMVAVGHLRFLTFRHFNGTTVANKRYCAKFRAIIRLGESICVTVPNFVQNGKTDVEVYGRFSIF